MPQNEHIELWQKRHGRQLDHYERRRKKIARMAKERATKAKTVKGLKAKIFHKKRYAEKAQMKKKVREHEEKLANSKTPEEGGPANAVPAYLMDRKLADRQKILSNTVKQKRKDKVGKWSVPVPKVKPLSEDEMFRVIRSGKRGKKQWKRLINKVSFVPESFTRKPPKYERFIRPMGLRFKKAHVTHPELRTTFYLPIIGVKKNPQCRTFTNLGVITKGTVIEVNCSELGLVTPGGKIVWGKYAQVTNNPENDGVINSVLLV